MQWVARIHRAFEQDRSRLVCQPIVPISCRERAHYELLIRVTDEKGQELEPGSFLAAAERYDLIQKIDRWVIEKAFHEVGHVMGNKTIAEFVENEDVLDKLVEVGVDFAQGFYFGQPQPLEEFVFESSYPEVPPERAPRLPIAAVRHVPQRGEEHVPPAGPVAGQTYRVLHVDDDPIARTIAKSSLEKAGFEVWSVASGHEALDLIARRGLPHLALVDIFMPGMNGLELCKKLQAFSDLPIMRARILVLPQRHVNRGPRSAVVRQVSADR